MWRGAMDVTMVVACDAGGPIQAGDNVCCMGPYVTKGRSCGCERIALQDLSFRDMPLEPLPVLEIMWAGGNVVHEAGQGASPGDHRGP